jgi:DNA-directed RNA polymerase specialized sigma24 family protein
MTQPRTGADDPLARLLRRLGPSPDEAGEAYEALRRLLHRFFEIRRCADASSLCDEVIDRLGRRLDDGTDVADVTAYARGIARLVHLEASRRPQIVPLDDVPAEPPSPDPDGDTAATCLEGCLTRLEAGTQRHVLTYYTSDGRTRIDGRKRLAAELGISATALRIRMLRARLTLERCVTDCQARGTTRNVRSFGSTYQ